MVDPTLTNPAAAATDVPGARASYCLALAAMAGCDLWILLAGDVGTDAAANEGMVVLLGITLLAAVLGTLDSHGWVRAACAALVAALQTTTLTPHLLYLRTLPQAWIGVLAAAWVVTRVALAAPERARRVYPPTLAMAALIALWAL